MFDTKGRNMTQLKHNLLKKISTDIWNIDGRRQIDAKEVAKIVASKSGVVLSYWENPAGEGQNLLPPTGRVLKGLSDLLSWKKSTSFTF